MKKKIIIFITSIVIFTSLLSIESFAVTGFTRTPLRGQETDWWCWCASNQMLLETQGRFFTQTQIANGLNSEATMQQQVDRLERCAGDIQWDSYEHTSTFDKVKRTINLGWAICCLCYTSNNGHAMVITGYDENSAGFNNVWLQDPWGNSTSPHTGVEGWCNYQSLINGNYSGTAFAQFQGHIWGATIV